MINLRIYLLTDSVDANLSPKDWGAVMELLEVGPKFVKIGHHYLKTEHIRYITATK